uniref:Uncharacterized protein n=1 Tax=Rhizophora mucronata TaxID=61149 RepID=A0A2P2PH94_RHIMU
MYNMGKKRKRGLVTYCFYFLFFLFFEMIIGY